MSRDPIDAHLRQVQATIAEHGWVIQGVMPDDPADDTPSFAYTVGMAAAGLNELVMSGLPVTLMSTLLNDACQRHVGEEIRAGGELSELASVPFRTIEAPLAAITVARALYGPQVGCVQLVWPDRGGRYPAERGWRPAARQELFGPPWWPAQIAG